MLIVINLIKKKSELYIDVYDAQQITIVKKMNFESTKKRVTFLLPSLFWPVIQ